MHGPIHKLAALAVCCWLSLATGCAGTIDGVASFITNPMGKSPESALGIKTPADRAAELKELAKTAHKRSPEDQQRITLELADEIKNESDPAMRRQILRTLTDYPTPLAFSLLRAGLSDTDLEVRRLACECLGERGGADAVAELSRVATSDTDTEVRIAAVRALGKTGDQAALSPLAEALADADPALQFRAQESLRTVSGHDFGDDVQAWREYAKTGKSNAPEINFAERLRRRFF